MSKHTSGHWTAETVHYPAKNGGWQSFVIRDGAKRSVASCSANSTRDGHEIQANAMLIAAAPLMLDMLELAAKHIPPHRSVGAAGNRVFVLDLVKAAIDQAKGQ